MRKLFVTAILTATLGLSGCDNLPDYVKAFFGKIPLPANVAAGSFKGQLRVIFVDPKGPDDRNVQLIEAFGFKDSKGVDWDVPAGFISDGASIPWSLWTFIGGPYDGPYRDAAILHDYFCTQKDRPWEQVHAMFLEAAVKRGTLESTAQTMYAGILYGGPRWPAPAVAKKAQLLPDLSKLPARSWQENLTILAQAPATPGTPPAPGAPAPSATGKATPGTPPVPESGITKRKATPSEKQQFEEINRWIKETNPTPEQIRQRMEELRKAKGLSK